MQVIVICLVPYLISFVKTVDTNLQTRSFLPQDTFTYFSEAHGSTSWIDHCLTSESVHQAVESMQVLHDYISSDHSPLVVIICCTQLPELCKVKSHCNTNNINKVDWNKLSQELKYEYSVKTKQLLEKISLPRDAIQCHDPVCSNASHNLRLKIFMMLLLMCA